MTKLEKNSFKTYHEIKEEASNKLSVLLKDCKVFFAFSEEQFSENKTELKEGEKYVSIGAGGYMPKSYVKDFIQGQKDIEAWRKSEVKKGKQQEAQILYELNNYECFYTGDIEDAFEVLKDTYSIEQVKKVFYKHLKQQQQYF
jgi:hypothetical protein